MGYDRALRYLLMTSVGNVGKRLSQWVINLFVFLVNLPIVYLAMGLFPENMRDAVFGHPMYIAAPPHSESSASKELLVKCLTYLGIITVVFIIDLLALFCLKQLGPVKGTFKATLENAGGKITVAAAELLGGFAFIGALIFLGMYCLAKVFS